jgi:hypothetical protein
MKLKIFKPALLSLVALLVIQPATFAQTMSLSVSTDPVDVSVKTNLSDPNIKSQLKELGKTLKASIKDVTKNLSVNLNGVVPKIDVELNNLGEALNMDLGNIEINGDSSYTNQWTDESHAIEKIKNYSKTYSIDGNDRIKLSNQYGKIVVNTWERHEVKVDVQIKAEARDDDYAQKLLDGVQIIDSKEGDQVSFRTQIGNNSNSWSLFNWGGGNKSHKLTINYTVYMPAKTDLNVEQSYGGIELPDLYGKVKISSSYGSVSAQNLTNPSNEIDGSYGSLKMGALNGGRLNFSYGSVDMEECTNIKADMSYGSFKLGKLKGAADFNLSYVGGFKIEEVAGSLKKINVNADYSSVSMGMSGGASFDFDISTSYGGFNYNEGKVTNMVKTPPDGSRHIGSDRNYKGHFGKEGSDAQVTIRTNYGSVNFE